MCAYLIAYVDHLSLFTLSYSIEIEANLQTNFISIDMNTSYLI